MAKTVTKDLTRSKAYRELRQSLLEDLRVAGLERLPYTDLVGQYMTLWVQLQQLNQDVAERGVYIEYQNGSTQKGITDNKSLSSALRVGARMDDILKALGYMNQASRAGASSGSEDNDPL